MKHYTARFDDGQTSETFEFASDGRMGSRENLRDAYEHIRKHYGRAVFERSIVIDIAEIERYQSLRDFRYFHSDKPSRANCVAARAWCYEY